MRDDYSYNSCKQKMLPDTETENCTDDDEVHNDHPQFSTRPSSSLQSSISKRANTTRRNLKGLSEGVQQRFQIPITHCKRRSMHRISEDDTPTTPMAPPRPNRRLYRNSLDQSSIIDREKAENEPDHSRNSSDNQSTSSSDGHRSNWSQSVELIENALHRNYYTIAYTIVIIAYLVGFAEYLYFRLSSLINPDHIVFHPPCEGKASRKIGKDGFHYGVSICAFIGVAIFQLMCFFGLTISEKWTVCNENRRENQQAAHRADFALFVRTMISSTMYRVFLCYAVCSIINCAIIFYMVAIQDSLGDTFSTILLYVFDAVVILYFIAFPLTTVIYHPYVNCLRESSSSPSSFRLPPPNVRTQTSTLESNISGVMITEAPKTAEVPRLNFSRQDPHRQVCRANNDIPVLEEYLHSPRRAVQSNVDNAVGSNERYTTFV